MIGLRELYYTITVNISRKNGDFDSFRGSDNNKDFRSAFDFISNIKDRFNLLNPDFQLPWKETDSEDIQIFQGVIVLNKKGFKCVTIPTLANQFYLIKKNNHYTIGKEYNLHLYFYLNGIKAEVISEVSNKIN